MTELNSKSIEWLRSILVVMVLSVHVHPDYNPNWVAMDQLSGQPAGWILFSVAGTFLNKLSFIAVPLFFFISGYLFFHKLETWSWDIYRRKLATRVRSLLVPYLIFNAVCFISAVASGAAVSFPGWLWNSVTYCHGWRNWLGMSMQLQYPLDVPLWFVRDLMVMIVLAPAIHWLLRRCGICFLAASGIAYWLGIMACTPGFSSNALFFFSLGAYFSLGNKDMAGWSRRHIRYIMPLFFALWIAASMIVEPGKAQPFENMLFTLGIPVLFYVAGNMVEKGRVHINQAFASAGFFIYSVHMVNFGRWSLLSSAGRFGNMVFDLGSPAGAAFGYCAEILYIIAAGTATYMLMIRFAPKLADIITGGRQSQKHIRI